MTLTGTDPTPRALTMVVRLCACGEQCAAPPRRHLAEHQAGEHALEGRRETLEGPGLHVRQGRLQSRQHDGARKVPGAFPGISALRHREGLPHDDDRALHVPRRPGNGARGHALPEHLEGGSPAWSAREEELGPGGRGAEHELCAARVIAGGVGELGGRRSRGEEARGPEGCYVHLRHAGPLRQPTQGRPQVGHGTFRH